MRTFLRTSYHSYVVYINNKTFIFASDLNPEYTYNAQAADHPHFKKKVVKGGSWKDIGAFLQIGARDYEYQDTAKSYIGFRCVVDFLGRDKQDFE